MPGQLWLALKKRLTIVVEINNDNYYFVPIAEALNVHSIKALSRTKVLDGGQLTIGYDKSIGRFGRRLCTIERTKEESASGRFKQTIRLTFPFAAHRAISATFERFVRDLEEQHTDSLRVYQVTTYGRELTNIIPKRSKSTVYINARTLERVESRLKFFVENRRWYLERGIPYKHNILLYGPPGNGKTTLVKYLAGLFGYSLVVSTPEKINDAAAATAVVESVAPSDEGRRSLAPETFSMLLEDIDCFGITQERSTKTTGSDEDSVLFNLSTLLNLLDGVNSYDGMLVFATTNNIEALDAALTRRARFDDIIFIGELADAELKKMLRVFFGDDAKINAASFPPTCGAEAQEIVLNNLDDIDGAISQLHQVTLIASEAAMTSFGTSLARVGRSEAGKRILAAGLAFEASQNPQSPTPETVLAVRPRPTKMHERHSQGFLDWLNSHWRGGMSAGIISDELDCIVSRSAILGIVHRRRQIEGPDFWPSRRPSRVRKYPEGRKRRFLPCRSPTTSEKPI